MIEHVDTMLIALQAAAYARELYDPQHPAVGEQLRRSAEALQRALKGREAIRIVVLDDRIMLADSSLPSSQSLRDGLGARLRAKGIECLVFAAPVSQNDLASLLCALAEPGPAPASIGAGVTLGHLDAATAPAGAPSLGVSPEDLRRKAPPLQQIWRRMAKGQSSADLLAAIVADICAVVSVHRGSLLPLAMLKSHDEYTFVHAVNVAILSAALAEALGMRQDDLHDLTIAALLHDIGKQETPRALLHKQGAFTDEEWEILRQHPVAGARILFETPGVPDVAPIVAFEHHLRHGGGGYPEVGPAWRMHFASRIVQVADIFDALRTDRPYRRALSVDDAIAELTRLIGAHDPALLQIFIDRVARSTVREHAELARRRSA